MPLTAKYATTCGVCRNPIAPGEEIAKAGRGWGHVGCAGGGDGQQSLIAVAAPESDLAVLTAPADAAGPAAAGAAASGAAPGAASGVLEVWTDGACSGNPGPGGWAWATKDGRQGSGGAAATTNQRMEVQAALEAITALGSGPLVVVSDSTYVVNCFRDGWWRGWLARGWTNSAKKPVANRDLWEPLVDLVRDRADIRFRWVKGHSGDPMNDLVDRLAVEAAKAAKPS